MKTINYSDLKSKGNILIWVEGGLVQEVYNPKADKIEWNKKVLVLDFDGPEPYKEGYTQIEDEDSCKRFCILSEW